MQFINKNTKRKISAILPGKKRASPVPHLVKTNDIPSDSEITLVQDALAKAQEELQVLEYQLGRTTATHQDALTKDRKSCQKFIRTHTAVLSLVRRIPDDILVTIFEHVAFSPRAYYSYPPWSLSQVCSNWRALALALPYLWKCIDLKLDVGRQKTHAFLTYLTNHLDRSKQVPLDIFVSFSSSAYDIVHHPFIDILCRYAERWGSVSAGLPGTTLQAFAGVKGRLTMLHSVSINLMSPGPYQDGTPLDMFEDASKLRRFFISGHVPSLRLHLPWLQLSSYENMHCSRVGVTEALAAPQLQRLALHHRTPFNDLVPLPTTTLDSLQHLSITFNAHRNHDDIPKGYLDGLTLPALEELRLVNCGVPNTSVLTALIKRSHCTHLTSLEFAPFTAFSPGELSGILRLVPQLTALATFMPDLNDLEDLVLRGTPSTDLVPSLQRLTLHAPALLDRDHGRGLAALAASRCEKAVRPMGLRVVVYTPTYWHATQAHLEAAFASGHVAYTDIPLKEDKTRAVAGLKDCIEALHALLRAPVRDNPLARAFDGGTSPAMKEFERSMEELMVGLGLIQFDDEREFHEAGLHHLLYHIVQVIECEAEKIGQRGGFWHWQERGEKLLDKWNKLYVFPFTKYRRWAFQGFHSFVYVPLDDDSRQVDSGVLRMVYGKTFFADKYHTQPHAVSPQAPSQLTYRD